MNDEVTELRQMGRIAAKLAVLVLGAYQRDNEAAMRAFGGNSAAHVANDLSGTLMRFKIQHPPAEPPQAPSKAEELPLGHEFWKGQSKHDC